MNVLAHVHTFNDSEVIDRAVQALLEQTYPLREILLVDNASTDSTLERSFPAAVRVVRCPINLGTSGACATGFQYAVARGYDWMWVLDADSVPRPDALRTLIDLYDSFDQEAKAKIGILGCSHLLVPSSELLHGRRLTPHGVRQARIDPTKPYCECDCTMWSGGLFRLEAVRAVGLPRCGTVGYWEDLSNDYGDFEFTYRITRAGYRLLVHRFSIVEHPVGRLRPVNLWGRTLLVTNYSASRRYLQARNLVFFWLYLHRERRIVWATFYIVGRLLFNITKIVLLEPSPALKVWACLRGTWDGFRRNLANNLRPGLEVE